MTIPAKLIGRSTRSSATVLKSLTSRGVLTWQEREIATVSALASLGADEED